MSVILKSISTWYTFLFNDVADSRVKSYLLMDNPFLLLGILTSYIYFIYKLGPNLMKNRKPFSLDKVLLAYNLFQILACVCLFYQGTVEMLIKHNLFCPSVDYSFSNSSIMETKIGWMYFILKVVDLLDTIFFTLRKKYSQITFLHVYHHFGMCVASWLAIKYAAGGHMFLVGYLNTLVHIFMYIYYLLSAWNKEYKKSLWWKKHITQLQILQFLIVFLYFFQILFQPYSKYAKWLAFILLPQNLLMLILFTKFYIKAYVKPQEKHDIVQKGNRIITSLKKSG